MYLNNKYDVVEYPELKITFEYRSRVCTYIVIKMYADVPGQSWMTTDYYVHV